MAEPLTQGTVVAGRYRLERLLGRGGQGEVWAGTHLLTRKGVALKFLLGTGATVPALVRRFMREARAASAVKHPNVVQIHDVIQLEDGAPVMIMDLLDGESLGDRVERQKSIPLRELANILVPVISAIGSAHALGIVHRDLKPDNIFLARYADGRVEPKVLDFGIAKLSANEGDAAQTGALTGTGSMLGTPYYMSPEQCFGEKDIDHRSDVWALGVILYECLAGTRPVDGDNFGQILKVITTGAITPLSQVAPQLPHEVTDLVTRMLKTDRTQRPPDLKEAFDVLKRSADAVAPSFDGVKSVVNGDGGQPRTLGAVTAPDAFAQTAAIEPKRRRGAAVGGAALLVAVLGGGLWAVRSRTAAPIATPDPTVLGHAAATGGFVPTATTPSLEPPAPVVAPATPSSAPPVTVGAVVATDPGAKTGTDKNALKTGAKSAGKSHTTSTAAATPNTEASSKTPTKLPGGILEVKPF